ncbi:hypothetical protein [Massilia sp. S19_KUP03_FR1]|uniref:hypothetical protein n=1 Tax=Massilia sp. S19_KUP03_FR1 TaxID=3025503 RepID=UPI002FCD97FB
MNQYMVTAALACLAIATVACSKKDMTPGEVSRQFLVDLSTADIDAAQSRLGPALRSRFLEKPALAKSAAAERKLSVEKCGGYKDITPSFNVTPEQTTVEGYSLLEYKGGCPSEKQYVRLNKNEGNWLIVEFGPLVKL